MLRNEHVPDQGEEDSEEHGEDYSRYLPCIKVTLPLSHIATCVTATALTTPCRAIGNFVTAKGAFVTASAVQRSSNTKGARIAIIQSTILVCRHDG